MKIIAISLWLLILCIGIGVYVFAPQTLESLLCYPGESIQSGLENDSDLYCADSVGNVRDVSTGIIVPFVFFMIVTPLFAMFIVFLNRTTHRPIITDPENITWRKRLKVLGIVVFDMLGTLLYIVDPPDHSNVNIRYRETWQEIKAKWAYVRGNPTPLIAFMRDLDTHTTAKKNKT